MNIVQKIASLLFALTLAFFGVAASVSAFTVPAVAPKLTPEQMNMASTTTTLLATVNMYDATSTQVGRTFTISFDLTNRVGVQPGVKYAVQLIQEINKIPTVVDEHVYDEVVNLGENSSIFKVITYTPPAHIDGLFALQLVTRNTNAFPFGTYPLGTVKIAKDTAAMSPIFIDTATCFLTIPGEKASPHYTLLQGVDIAPSEQLESHCSVTNISDAPLTVTPSFVTRARSNFGDIVPASGGGTDAVTLAPGEKKVVTTLLPKASASQAYNTDLTYGASNKITFHYVIQGGSGTIQSIILDKDTYAAGETAKLSFIWTGSADTFQGSRIEKGTDLAAPSFTASIVDENGTSCAEPFTKTLGSRDVLVLTPITMTASCTHPKVSLTLSDGTLGVLGQATFDTASTTPLQGQPMRKGTMYPLLAFLAVVIAVAAYYFKKHTNITPVAPLIALVMIAGMFGTPQEAKADTLAISGYYCTYCGATGIHAVTETYTIQINKRLYAPGETIVAWATMSSMYCANGTTYTVGRSWLTALINGANQYVYYGGQVTSYTAAQWTPGVYNAYFYAQGNADPYGLGEIIYCCLDGNNNACCSVAAAAANIWYEVAAPVNAVCAATAYNCAAGYMPGAGYYAEYSDQYHWWCYGQNGGSNAPLCVQYKPSTCSSVGVQAPTTAALSGPFYVYAYGVSSLTTAVSFPTWGDAGGQDDIVWYPGTNLGGGTWRATVDLANHKAGNPEFNNFTVHAYMYNPSVAGTYCGASQFSRSLPPVPVVTLTANTSGGSSQSSVPAYYGEVGTVTWTATNGATSCNLYSGPLVFSGAYPASMSYTTPPLTANTPYQMVCTNAGGNSIASNVVNFIVPPPPISRGATCSGNSMTLNWTLPSGYTEAYVRAYKTPPSVIDYNAACAPAKTAPDGTCSVVTGTSLTMAATQGSEYYWYLHTKATAPATTWSTGVGGGTFSCPLVPVNGACTVGSQSYRCDAGTSASNVSGATNWTWSCTGANGGTTASCATNKPPTGNLSVNGGNSATIPSGSTVTVSWTSTLATSCSVSPGTFTSGATNAGQASAALTADQTYTLNCTGAGGNVPVADTAIVTVTPNTPPTISISGPTTGLPATDYTFTFLGTDASVPADQIKYEIDWDNDGTVDMTRPSTGYYSSGAARNQANNWAGLGTKYFKARTVDSRGAMSAWATHTIVIDLPPALTVTALGDFGTVAATEVKDKTFTVQNTGGGTLNVTGIADIETIKNFACISGCTSNLVANATQIVTIRLTAPSTIGALPSETIRVTSSNAGTKDVQAWANIVPVISINPGPLNFGNVIRTKFKDLPLSIINNSSSVNVPAGNITVTAPFSCATGGTVCSYGAINAGFPPAIVMIRFSPVVDGVVNGVGTLNTVLEDNTGDMLGTGIPPTFDVIEK